MDRTLHVLRHLVDEAADLFIGDMPSIYLVNDRFIGKETQGNGVLMHLQMSCVGPRTCIALLPLI